MLDMMQRMMGKNPGQGEGEQQTDAHVPPLVLPCARRRLLSDTARQSSPPPLGGPHPGDLR
ncbi:MAG: hypothetical protein MK312_04235, partial [Roseibacillus sp.]|nr:hypothetical protein [Roseibacillus sp.]